MDFSAPLNAFVAGFPNFIIQLAVALGLFVASLIIYVLMTPHKELALIRAGNPSAALAFGGVVVGLAIPLGSCLAYAFGLWDLVIWGVITLACCNFGVPLRRSSCAACPGASPRAMLRPPSF